MLNAVELSRRGLGATAENPPVGCILVRDGMIAGRGFTAPGGRPHAETIALLQAGDKAHGSTAYVTLEPCFHHGQTAPCSQALITAGIARVVCAVRDPDDRVSGKGLAQLRDHNIEVLTGVCEAQARQVLAGYLLRKTINRPSVVLKLAISQDEMLASNDPENRWITGPLARDRGHLMRSQCDAIIVGIGTVIADDPDLTCRLPGLEDLSPRRVIVDTHLRTPVTSRLVQTAHKVPVMIACSQEVEIEQSLKLYEKGVEIIPCAVKSGHIDLSDLLAKLADHGVNRSLFEGGAEIAATLAAERLIDELAIFQAPHIIGEKGTPAFASMRVNEVVKQLSLVEEYKLDVGGDEMTLYHRRMKD